MEYISNFERNCEKRGLERGRLEGEVRILSRQLSRRFDQLPNWVPERLQKAGTKELERWSDRVLIADSLNAVFDDPVDSDQRP